MAHPLRVLSVLARLAAVDVGPVLMYVGSLSQDLSGSASFCLGYMPKDLKPRVGSLSFSWGEGSGGAFCLWVSS